MSPCDWLPHTTNILSVILTAVSPKRFAGVTRRGNQTLPTERVRSLRERRWGKKKYIEPKSEGHWLAVECAFPDVLWQRSLLPSRLACQVMLWYLLVWCYRFIFFSCRPTRRMRRESFRRRHRRNNCIFGRLPQRHGSCRGSLRNEDPQIFYFKLEILLFLLNSNANADDDALQLLSHFQIRCRSIGHKRICGFSSIKLVHLRSWIVFTRCLQVLQNHGEGSKEFVSFNCQTCQIGFMK